MPESFPPILDPTSDEYDPTAETISVAKAVFARHNHCLVKEVDEMIDGNRDLQAEFDAIMDYVARDALVDECNIGIADATFIHLSDLGLVNPAPVKVVKGVAISTHRPYWREQPLVIVEPPVAADDTERDPAVSKG